MRSRLEMATAAERMYLCLAMIVLAAVVDSRECPELVAQFTDSLFLNRSGFRVYLDSDDVAFQNLSTDLVVGGEVIPSFASVEEVEQLTSSGTINPLRGELQSISIHLQLDPSSSQPLYSAMSVWSLDQNIAVAGCPNPDTEYLKPGEQQVVDVVFGCKLPGMVIMQACITVGDVAFTVLNGTYHTYTFFLPLQCKGENGSCNPANSIVPGELCLEVNQTRDLISNGAGNWDLLLSAFSESETRRGYCLVNVEYSDGVPIVVADRSVSRNFPISEVFSELDLYITLGDQSVTPPIVYSLSFIPENRTVMDMPFISIPSQGLLFEGYLDFTLYLPCLTSGQTVVHIEFNVSAFVGGTLYSGLYSPLFYRNCTPVNNDTILTSASNNAVKVAVPVIVILCVLGIAGLIIVSMVLLTKRQKKRILEITAEHELEDITVSNAYLRQHVKDPFSFLEEYDIEYNYPSLEIVDELGEGCFGRVFKARAPGLHRGDFYPEKFVAVKTLKDDKESTLLEEFCKEVKICIQFNNENVIRLVGVCTKSYEKCMIFEYMDLGGLNDILRLSDPQNPEHLENHAKENLLTPDLFLHCAVQVAEGMAYLAELKFVHRDIASRNCLVNSKFVVKIADFGMSRELNASDYYRVGSTKAFLPIRWMPPEAILYGKFTLKSDVWSFGVLVWEIFTYGKQPFSGQSNYEVIDRLKAGQMLECPTICPPPVFAIMQQCWTRMPSKRPAMCEVLSQLHQLARLARGGRVDPTSITYVNLNYGFDGNDIHQLQGKERTSSEQI